MKPTENTSKIFESKILNGNLSQEEAKRMIFEMKMYPLTGYALTKLGVLEEEIKKYFRPRRGEYPANYESQLKVRILTQLKALNEEIEEMLAG